MNLEIKTLTPDLIKDYFDFFDNRAFSDNAEWSCCYCTYFHMNEDSEQRVKEEVGDGDTLRYCLRSRAEKLIVEGILHGYLAYAAGIPIGFCNANDKSSYSRHINDTFLENAGRTKAVACFVIAPEYRGQGAASALLERIILDAKIEGFSAVEGYPKLNEKSNAENFTGPQRMYEKAGFSEVVKLDDQAVMRKVL